MTDHVEKNICKFFPPHDDKTVLPQFTTPQFPVISAGYDLLPRKLVHKIVLDFWNSKGRHNQEILIHQGAGSSGGQTGCRPGQSNLR